MSTALNLCTYLLFKCDAIQKENKSIPNNDTSELLSINDQHVINDMKNHPIISHLDKLSTLADQIQTKIEKPLGLTEQLQSLVQAIQLMNQEKDDIGNDNDVSKDVSDQQTQLSNDDDADIDDDDMDPSDSMEQEDTIKMETNLSNTLSSSDDDSHEETSETHLLNDARFGIRPQDMQSSSKFNKQQRRRAAPPSTSLDYGDDDDMVDDETRRNASKALATTMNTIAQKSKTLNKTKSSADGVDDIMEREIGTGVGRGDYIDEDEINRGLKMMDDELGPEASDDDYDNELEDDMADEGDALYELMKKKSQTKKQKRKEMYAVAPKYPRLDTEVEGMSFIVSFHVQLLLFHFHAKSMFPYYD